MKPGNEEADAVTTRLEEASEWLVRLQQDDVTEADVAAWLKWCAADKASMEAFERVQQLYDQLQALPVSEKKAFARLHPAPGSRLHPRDLLRSGLEWLRERSFPEMTGLAAMSLAAVVGLITVGVVQRMPVLESRDYQAPRGVQQSLLLADRSHITLASASEIVSDFTPSIRLIKLRKGEAYFEVQHDQKRPFVVKTDAMTVTAVGTKFNVRTSGTRTVVAVTEGAVEVTTEQTLRDPLQGPGSEGAGPDPITIPVRLKAGQQAIRDSAHPGLTIVDVNAASATDWRQGRLEYVMEPLSSVVEDVNRYTARHIEIKDAALGDLVFTGTIFIDRVDDWAMTLPAAFPVAATLAGDGTLSLKSRSNEKRP
jgi:transmembrane sensor